MALSVTPTDEMKTLTVGEKIYEIVDDQAREDVSEAKTDFLQSLIYDTASGAVATFPDGAHELPCKSVVAQIEPAQDLHGYDSPWPAGGGKNKFNTDFESPTVINGTTITKLSDGRVTTSGVPSASFDFVIGTVSLPTGDYILNGCPANGGPTTYRLQVTDYPVVNNLGQDSGSGVSFTLSQDMTVAVRIQVYTGASASLEYKPMICLANVSDATFAPYSNICPISGWDSVKVTRNAGDYATMDSVLNNSVLDSSGAVVYENRMVTTDYMPVSQGDEVRYYLVSKEGARARRVVAYNADKTFNSILFEWSWITVNSVVERTFTIASGIAYVRACYYSGDTDKSFVNKTLENTYSVSLPQTVYGGQVDVVSGEGVSKGVLIDMGSLSWRRYASSGLFYASIPAMRLGTTLTCSHYAQSLVSNVASIPDGCIWNKSNAYNSYNIVVNDSRYATASDFATAVSGVMLVYELTNPTDFEVTPQTVSTLYGSNTVYADSGDIFVEYSADTKLYISRLTEPDSADMIADANIVSGKYFMVGNDLYLATANIANGGAITPGTNCTKVSLATALNAINS